MNAKDFSVAMNEVNDKYVNEAITYKRKRKKAGWVKWGAMAACVCLVLLGAITLSPLFNSSTQVPIEQSGTNLPRSNSIPQSGEYYCFANVNEAREYYKGQDVTFLLIFDMFDAEGKQLSEDEKVGEYERLTALGYKLHETEYWTYQGEGEKENRSIVVGEFTESELADFDVSEEYGYAFRFVQNGDGSPISIGDAISSF